MTVDPRAGPSIILLKDRLKCHLASSGWLQWKKAKANMHSHNHCAYVKRLPTGEAMQRGKMQWRREGMQKWQPSLLRGISSMASSPARTSPSHLQCCTEVPCPRCPLRRRRAAAALVVTRARCSRGRGHWGARTSLGLLPYPWQISLRRPGRKCLSHLPALPISFRINTASRW
jgi:hypothetical protein